MKPRVAIYRDGDDRYLADTCEPLKRAVKCGEVQVHAQVHGAYPGDQLPERCLPEVRSVGYWDAEHQQRWGLDWHRNEGIEFTYVARGHVQFGIGDQRYLLKRGALTITRPWQAHRVGDPNIDASQLHWLIFDVGVRRPNHEWRWPSWVVLAQADLMLLTTLLSHNEQPVWQANDEVAYYFERLGHVARSRSGDEAESHLALYINGLLLAVKDLLQGNQVLLDSSLTSNYRTVEMFLHTLSSTVEESWTLDTMAAACGLARSRFTHYCKRITNMSPNEYLRHCRIEAACTYLRDSTMSITDVAFTCGFGSSQYFATVFQLYQGCSPRSYREHHSAVNDHDSAHALVHSTAMDNAVVAR